MLADAGPAIQRAAIFLAVEHRDVLIAPEPGEIPSRWWWHRGLEWFSACTLRLRAFALR